MDYKDGGKAWANSKFVLFTQVKVGDEFFTGGRSGADSKWTFEVFKKDSGSTGKWIDQIGYGNTRLVGGIKKFGPNAKVRVEKAVNEDAGLATLGSVEGMGAPVLASRGVVGSGDVASGRRKKIKKFGNFRRRR